ncbi:fasciclin domain-containing protein [Chitinophaga niabensis]|uniref:Fasciclin domain-containing protein n=1 Tax=Chitinophaga niabensis TaxID=536979 RepID=A0A1N6K513_9BACT|nr:fasciclin domain-containing protein [Chitinophaga niabensis]SIO51645.1 Fasciclin domain-containing protein [Chitinophaga niabensis]
MKSIKQYILPLAVLGCLTFASCDKLQDGYDYNASIYDTKVNSNVYDFMKSKPELFSSMLSAIDYVDKDANFKDVKQMYTSTGNTFLLLTNTALSNLEDGNSFFVLNPVTITDPSNPDFGKQVRGTDFTQYPVQLVADLLRYHVMKGRHEYANLNSTPHWVNTFAISSTNDSAKVHIYLQATREGYLFLNNYIGAPSGWTELRPRTPNLLATNGVIHIMNRWLRQPTRQIIENNK